MWLTVAVSLAAAGAAFLYGRSLAQEPIVDVDSQEQGPAVALALVESRYLAEDILFRADIIAQNETEIAPPQLDAGVQPVITKASLRVGDKVESGDLMVAVADRPVIVLRGEVAMFRDVRPQDSGSDVVQLQQALIDLGFELELDGLFGRETEEAVAALYASVGAAMKETGGQEQVDALERELSAAKAGGSSAEIRKAQTRLNEFGATVGRYLPRGELAFVATLPARLLALPSLGEFWGNDTESTKLTITSSVPTLTGLVPIESVAELELGYEGVAIVEPNDAPVDVRVEEIGTAPVTDEAGTRVRVTLSTADPLGFDRVGQNVLVTIEGSGPSEAVTAVPVSAIVSDSATDTYVLRPDGSRVKVQLGYSADGWVEVTAGDIEVGDEVIVGLEP